ncbi:MAG: glycosyltransferase [Deltaproteobacteria bacterium]|jgi:GT2 family glycosyltransferase|nr:glycosyltransferase [Deltaproteobacteria bacterium]MBW2533189.1 glycosyltransferase [Deltaproteobacteria bacterium]
MIPTWLAILSLALAALPAGLLLSNLRAYRAPRRRRGDRTRYAVSVLIPARNEQHNIGGAVRSVLANADVDLDVVVLDDGSTDDTPRILRQLRQEDERVRLVQGEPLPPGANGKQHACAQLALQARNDYLVFMDADVRLTPDALGRMVGFLKRSGAQLASGIPRQQTGSFGERAIVPLIHFVLLAFLPLGRMRRSRHPAYAAGIGQLFVATRAAYERTGGHRAILSSRHDGLDLPRAFRRAGFATDLFDATGVASCRMYSSSRETWLGFLKNADQGLGHPLAIVPSTLLLMTGQILPWAMLLALPWLAPETALAFAGAAVLSVGARGVAAWRFRQPWSSALLHPLSIAALIGIQWHGLARTLLRRPARWKGRAYDVSSSATAVELPIFETTGGAAPTPALPPPEEPPIAA